MSSYASVNWVHARVKADPVTREFIKVPQNDTVPLTTWFPREDAAMLRVKLLRISPILTVPAFVALCANLFMEDLITLESKGNDYVIRATDPAVK